MPKEKTTGVPADLDGRARADRTAEPSAVSATITRAGQTAAGAVRRWALGSVLLSSPADILALQRTVGNQATLLLRADRGPTQPTNVAVQRKIDIDTEQLNSHVSAKGFVNQSTLAQIVSAAEKYQGTNDKSDRSQLPLLKGMDRLIAKWLDSGKSDSPKKQAKSVTLKTLQGSIKVEIDRIEGVRFRELLVRKVGIAPAFLDTLPFEERVHLADASEALLEGNIGKADEAMQLLQSEAAQAAKPLLKMFLLRDRLGMVNPKLAKSLKDPNFTLKKAKAARGAKKAKSLHATHAPGDTEQLDPTSGEWTQRRKVAPRTMTDHELTSIISYTSDAYKAFNQPLRGDVGTEKFDQSQLDVTQLIVSALNKLPAYNENNGRVYRHFGYFPGFNELSQVGGVYTDLALMSAAATLGGAGAGGQEHDILEVLDSKSGRDVSQLSAKGKGEKEVLFKPGSRFRITKRGEVDKAGQVNPADTFLQDFLDQDGKKKFIRLVLYKEEV